MSSIPIQSHVLNVTYAYSTSLNGKEFISNSRRPRLLPNHVMNLVHLTTWTGASGTRSSPAAYDKFSRDAQTIHSPPGQNIDTTGTRISILRLTEESLQESLHD